MSHDGLVLGLLDNSATIGDPTAAAKYRGFTISWSRYGYHDVILEHDTVDAILTDASQRDARYCLILPYGHLIAERWTPENRPSRDLFAAVKEWTATHDFFVTGSMVRDDESWFGFEAGCLLVDLEKYRQLGTPRFGVAGDDPIELPHPKSIMHQGRVVELLPSTETKVQRPGMCGWQFISTSLRAGVSVVDFPEEFRRGILNLEAACPDRVAAFDRYLDKGIALFSRESHHEGLSPDQVAFLSVVDSQTANSRRGVFLWNIESYDDIEAPRRDFDGPVSSLYSVAAGFKPNRILQTHGFDEDSRVVYFDYSSHALEVKKCMVEQWDGEDFPDFVKYLFRKFPHPDTFYQLWDDRTPENVDWQEIQAICERELVRWGGAENLRDHWQAYRQLRHEYVCCNILSDSSPLLEQVASEPGAIVWWSNAFFTVYGNWYHTLDERKLIYDRWIERMVAANPQLDLYGSDYNNINVNSIRAREYWDRYRRFDGDCLIPCKLYETEVRM